MARKNPCARTCPKRTIICHSVCKEYIDWAKEHREEVAQLRKEKDLDNAIGEIHHTGKRRRKK